MTKTVRKQAKNKGGRPRLPDAEKLRRGTLKPSRVSANITRDNGRIGASLPTEHPDYIAIARGYAADVLAGKIVACKWVRLACARQQRDLQRAASDPTWPYFWSDEHAIEACDFIEHLPHVEGRWTTDTIRLEPAQVFTVACLFGWRHRADPTRRRFTQLYDEMGRKNAKTTLAVAMATFHLVREREPGASVVYGATTGQQSRIAFSIQQRMVRRSAWLRDQGVEALANAIITSDGTAKPINAKASTQDGLNPSCIVLDESHAQTFELHDVLRSAQGARQNPLILAPTTAGYDLLSVGYALRTQLTKVLEGIYEADHLFGLIYTLDEGDDWRDPRVWIKSNPLLGVTPSVDWVQRYCTDAQQTPGLEGEFRVKVCSQWMQGSSAWLSMARWDACADPKMTLADFEGQPCWIGADLAQLDDLAAVALLFEVGDTLCGFVQFYLPAHVVDERAKAVPAYRQWAAAGILTLTEGPMIDYSVIEADIRAHCKRFKVQAIVFDQFGSAHISSLLAADGLPAVVEPKNAKTFTPPARELEARVTHGRFRHDGNPCLKWNASNAVVSRRIDDSLLPKKDSPESPNKIDGIDALLEAIAAKLRAPAPVAVREPFLLFVGGRR